MRERLIALADLRRDAREPRGVRETRRAATHKASTGISGSAKRSSARKTAQAAVPPASHQPVPRGSPPRPPGKTTHGAAATRAGERKSAGELRTYAFQPERRTSAQDRLKTASLTRRAYSGGASAHGVQRQKNG